MDGFFEKHHQFRFWITISRRNYSACFAFKSSLQKEL